MMRISFADAGLEALDALTGVDASCLFIVEDERPLRGIAGFVDWRLCGGLSRILQGGRFVGAMGDALLFPAAGRVPGERVFCFGAGRRSALTPAASAAVLRKAGQAMSLAGSSAFATELPLTAGLALPELAQLFLAECAARFRGERIVLLGDGRGLAKVFQDVGARLQGLQFDREPLGTAPAATSQPHPPSGLPHRAGSAASTSTAGGGSSGSRVARTRAE